MKLQVQGTAVHNKRRHYCCRQACVAFLTISCTWEKNILDNCGSVLNANLPALSDGLTSIILAVYNNLCRLSAERAYGIVFVFASSTL